MTMGLRVIKMAERSRAESMPFVGLSKTTTLCNIARRSLMEGLTVREKFNKSWKLLAGNFFAWILLLL